MSRVSPPPRSQRSHRALVSSRTRSRTSSRALLMVSSAPNAIDRLSRNSETSTAITLPHHTNRRHADRRETHGRPRPLPPRRPGRRPRSARRSRIPSGRMSARKMAPSLDTVSGGTCTRFPRTAPLRTRFGAVDEASSIQPDPADRRTDASASPIYTPRGAEDVMAGTKTHRPLANRLPPSPLR